MNDKNKRKIQSKKGVFSLYIVINYKHIIIIITTIVIIINSS